LCTNQFLLLPPTICIARTIAIRLHDYCAIYYAPPTPLLYAIHHTILVKARSCKGQKRRAVRADTVGGGARGRGRSSSKAPIDLCSADESTHTESNKLYRKVKHRARPNISSRQRPKRAPIRRRSRRRQRRGEPHTEHGLGSLFVTAPRGRVSQTPASRKHQRVRRATMRICLGSLALHDIATANVV